MWLLGEQWLTSSWQFFHCPDALLSLWLEYVIILSHFSPVQCSSCYCSTQARRLSLQKTFGIVPPCATRCGNLNQQTWGKGAHVVEYARGLKGKAIWESPFLQSSLLTHSPSVTRSTLYRQTFPNRIQKHLPYCYDGHVAQRAWSTVRSRNKWLWWSTASWQRPISDWEITGWWALSIRQ